MSANTLPTLEVRLRAPLREARRANPAARRQARAVRWSRFKSRLLGIASLAMVAAPGTAMVLGLKANPDVPENVARLALSSLLLLAPLAAALGLRSRLGGGDALLFLSLLPVGDDVRLRWQLRDWLGQLARIGLCALPLLVAAGNAPPFSARGLAIGVLGAVGLTLVSAALGVFSSRHANLFRALQRVTLLCGAVLVACLFFPFLRAPALAVLTPVADELTLTLPTGWIVFPLIEMSSTPIAPASLPLGLAAVFVGLAIWKARTWLPKVPLRDLALLAYAAEPPPGLSDQTLEEFHRQLERPPAPPPEEVRAAVLARGFLTPTRPPPTDGLFLWVWRQWTPRQRLIAEWGLEAWPEWRRRWLRHVVVIAAGLLGAALAQRWQQSLAACVTTAMAGCAAVSMLPWIFLLQRATQRTWMVNVTVPQFLLHAVTLQELLGVDRRRVWAQLALAAPVLAATGALTAMVWRQPASLGLLFAAKAVLLLSLLRSGLLTCWCARRLPSRLKSALFALGLMAGGLLSLGLAVVGFGFPEAGTLVPAAASALVMKGLAALTLRLWSRRWFENTLAAGA